MCRGVGRWVGGPCRPVGVPGYVTTIAVAVLSVGTWAGRFVVPPLPPIPPPSLAPFLQCAVTQTRTALLVHSHCACAWRPRLHGCTCRASGAGGAGAGAGAGAGSSAGGGASVSVSVGWSTLGPDGGEDDSDLEDLSSDAWKAAHGVPVRVRVVQRAPPAAPLSPLCTHPPLPPLHTRTLTPCAAPAIPR